MTGAWRGLVIALCALAGGVLNVYRTVWWRSGGLPQRIGFCAPAELQAHDLNQFAPGYCQIDIPNITWRPVDVTIRLRAPAPLPATAAVLGPATGRIVHITIDDPTMTAGVETVTIDDVWHAHTVTATTPPRPQAPLAVVLRVDQPPITNPLLAYVSAAPEVGAVDVVPRLTAQNLAWPTLAGAIVAVLGALLLAPGVAATRQTPAPASRSAATDLAAGVKRPRALLIFAPLLVYLAVWALVRPPFQTPDEVQHQMRASSVLRDPWVAQPGFWTIDPRFANPLAWWTPPMLGKLFFSPSQHLSRADVAALKAIPWPDASTRPPAEPDERAIASYPTLYYLTLFALAEPLTRLLALSPYDSTYAYRLVSAALAALCWTLALVQLHRLPATREHATAIGALLLLNPMTAFMSSAVNVDAVNIPLAVLAALLFWRLLTTGVGEWWTLATLLATCWTKPSGLQLIGALCIATLATRALAERLPLKPAMLTLARATIVAWVTFYAWSPPRFLGGQASFDTLSTYLATRWLGAFSIWITYWGKLGWLEYNVAPIWYVLVLIAVLIGIACALWRPSGSRAFMLFSATLLIAFVGGTLAGEFLYLPVSGYVLQGRHLLPACLGLALLVMHRVTAARVALLALLVLLNVLLIQATVGRYYHGQWKVAAAALPFTR